MTWRWTLALCVTTLAAAGAAGQAQALCIYRGELYAKSTITGEFRESSMVIRGTVLENHRIFPIDEDDPDLEYLVIARVRVERTFKGQAPREILLMSEQNSGGFYVDEGRSYLLFLHRPARPGWTRGYRPDQTAFVARYPRPRFINYSCGQSMLWSELSARKRRALDFETRRPPSR